MKTMVLILALCLGSQFGVAEATDGYEWSTFSSPQKYAFVNGWISGSNGVVLNFTAEIILTSVKEGKDLQNFPFKRVIEKLERVRGLKFEGINYEQIIQVIDQIYSDPRVKQWQFEEIMPIVRGRLKEGWTEKDVDEVIGYQLKAKRLFEAMKTSNQSEKEKVLKEMKTLRMPRVLILLEWTPPVSWGRYFE